ncbi:MAG: hypothetical protein WBP79_06325, partial [Candidatus Acidiferrales bacterium]
MRYIANGMLTALFVAVLSMSLVLAAGQQQSTPPPIRVPAPAEQPQAARPKQSPAIRASSDLVRIDVEVTDKSGKPVKGLRPEQFTITEDGRAQKISIFTYQDIESLETAKAEDTKPI